MKITERQLKNLLDILNDADKDDKCLSLLRLRNKVCEASLTFPEDEIGALSEIVLDHCENEGYITWDEDRQEYVRNSDGTPITDL